MEGEKVPLSGIPVLKKGRFLVNIPRAINELEGAMRRLPVKKILYKAIFRGKGLEFESYRKFEPDDDASMIDWKASLRANTLLAKKYIEERDLKVHFLLDVSNSMLFGSGDRLKSEYAAELVAALSHLIIGSGDQVGLVMVNDDIVKILHPSRSKNHFAILAKTLSDTSNYGGGFDFNKAIEFVLKRTTSMYNIFILVSDFLKLKESHEKSFRQLGNRHETLAIVVRDPLDEELPKTKYQFCIQDPYSNRQMVVDPEIASDKYHDVALHQKETVREVFKGSRVDTAELMINKKFAVPLVAFLKSRAGRTRV